MPQLKHKKHQRSERTFHPTISFIVPLFNMEAETARCIEKLFDYAAKYEGFVEIFIVYNGSQDNTYELAYAAVELHKRRKFPKVRTKLIRLTARLQISEITELCSKFALGQKIAVVKCEKTRIEAKTVTVKQ